MITAVMKPKLPRQKAPPLRSGVFLLLWLALPLAVTFSTIDSARWVRGLPSLLVPVILSLTMAHFLDRLLPHRVARALAIALGPALGIGAGFLWLPGSPVMGMGIFLVTTTWWAGCATLWMAQSKRHPSLVLLPGLVVLVVALAFLPSRYYLRLPLYLLASAPALALLHIYKAKAAAPRRAPAVAPLAAGSVLVAVALLPAWLAPTPSVPIRPGITSRLEEPWYKILQQASVFFQKVPNRKEWIQFGLPSALPFTGPIGPGEDVLMVVKASEPYKWRARVYETYTRGGWTRPDDHPTGRPDQVLPQSADPELNNREPVRIAVRTAAQMDILVSAGEPLAVSRPSNVELSPTTDFVLDLNTPQATYLPPDLLKTRDDLLKDGTPLQFRQVRRLADAGFEATGVTAQEKYTVTVRRLGTSPAPALALLAPEALIPPQQYATVGSVSKATPEMLREARQAYPTTITDRYLQLPVDFPETVRKLAREVASDKQNPYDIATAIQDYLLSLPYSTEVTAPPTGADGVEYFLTVQRSGYCQYFASAMITMLRSLGIPARLVVGFAPGDWDSQRNAWVVRSMHYHAWPEVYFPGYGWVEFEPTPAGVQPSLQSIGVVPVTVQEPLDECTGVEEAFGLSCEQAQQASSGTLEDLTGGGDDAAAGATKNDNGFWQRIPKPPVPWALVLGAAVVSGISGLLYLRRRGRSMSYPARVYVSMISLARLAGMPAHAHDTPLEFGSRMAARLPAQASAIQRVVKAYVYTQYGPVKALDKWQTTTLRASWLALRVALLRLALKRLLAAAWLRRRRQPDPSGVALLAWLERFRRGQASAP